MDEQAVGELAPADLAQVLLGPGREAGRPAPGGVVAHGVPHLSW
jgi:hypothetical protein